MKKKTMTIIGIYGAALVLALAMYAALSHENLETYRYAAKYSAQRSVEESVAAVNGLSTALKKSVYAVDGSMCGKICAESYADALAAQAALATLPFSTQELEEISGFLNTAGDYAYTLCSEAAEQGFTDEQVKTLSELSDTAAGLADSLRDLQRDLNDKSVEIDSTELRLENVGVEDTEKLSERLLGYEADLPQQKELDYDGKYSTVEKNAAGTLTDTQKLAAAAEFAGVGLGELKSEYEYKGEDGRRCYSAGELEICVSSRGVESMSQSRLVSEEKISEDEAREIASRFLNAHGYDSVQELSAVKNGAVEHMVYARVVDDALCIDETIDISVALDDGSIYAFNADKYEGGELECEWTVSAEQAAEKITAGLELSETKKVILKSEGGDDLPCYELECADGEKTVRIYVDAASGKQRRIEM